MNVRIPGMRHLLIVLLSLVVVSAASLVGLHAAASSDSTARVVTKLIGKPSLSPLVLHPERHVKLGVDSRGFVAQNRGSELVFGLADPKLGAWTRHGTGSVRTTSFGEEVVRYGLPMTEEYAIVRHPLHGRTLEWNLNPGVRAVSAFGAIDLRDGLGRPLNLALSNPRILDLAGHDITPAGTRWTVTRRPDGRQALALHTDEARLPSQYIVDPAVSFRAIAVATANAATSTSVTLPSTTASGDLLVVVLGINTTSVSAFNLTGGTATACTTGNFSTVDAGTFNTDITQVIWQAKAGTSDAGKTCTATWTGSGETVMYVVDYTTGTYYTSTPIDYAGPAGTTASTTYTSNNLSTYFYNEFLAFAAIEDTNKNPGAPTTGTWTARSGSTTYINPSGAVKIGSAYYDGATRATASSATVTGTAQNANHTIAAVFGVRQNDTTAPTAVSLTAPAANANLKNGATLTASVTDDASGSGAADAAFYYCVGAVTCNSTTGNPQLIGTTAVGVSPYSLTWSSQPADGTYTIFATGYDRAGNSTDSASVTVTVDNTAPTFTSAALSGASPAANIYLPTPTGLSTSTSTGNLYYKGNIGSTGSFKLQVGVADAGGSTLSSLSFPALTGTTTGWTHTTPDAPTVSGSSASATSANTFSYASGTTSGPVETATVTDKSGNTGTLALTMTNDITGPTTSVGLTANQYVGLNPTLTSTVTDAGSGVATVSYYYCAGTAPTCNFTTGSPTLIGTSSTGSTYGVTWNDSALTPTTYKVFAHSTDNVGNTTDSTAVTINLDNVNPTASVTTPAGGTYYRASTLSGLTAISGTAADTGGSSLASVGVTLQSPTGNYWNNTTHTWGAATVSNTPTGTASWSLALSSFTADGEGTYTITATPTDGVGNKGTTTRTFVYDATAPTGSIATPAASTDYNASTLSGFTSVAGAAGDATSGVSTITVAVQSANGNYWNNSTHVWSASTIQNAVTVAASWSLAVSSFTADGSGTYTIVSTFTDSAGNATTASRTFVYDAVAPTFGAFSVTKAGVCDSSIAVSGTTVYYNGTAACAGAFTVTEPISDTGGSGATTVSYPAVSTLGMTHSLDSVTSPFTSSTYGWSSAATYGGVQTVTGSDLAGNSATTSFTIAQDGQGPSTSITAPTGTTVKNGATLTATADDSTTGGSGVKQVEFRYCSGASCTYAASTPIATVTSGPYTTTWSSQPADGTYTLLVRATDNVGNVTDVTKTVTVDNTAPVYASSALNTAGTQVTITLTETGTGLDTSINTPASAYTVLKNGSGDTVTSVTQVDATHIRLGLTTRAYDGDTLTVAYSQPASSKEADLAGNLLPSFTAQTVTTAASASLTTSTVTASPTSIAANGSSTSTITVTLKNAAGTAMTTSGGTVTLATTAGSLGAVTDHGNGTYSATLTSSTVANPSVTVSAKLDGTSLTSSASVAFNAVTPTKLVFTQQPSSAAAGASTGTIKVAVEDASNNVVTSDSSSVTVALTTPGGATLSGTKSVAAVNGVATFTALSVDLANTYTLTATDGSLASAASASFTISPAAASKLVFTQQPASANAGASTGTITVNVEDSFGNTVTTDTSSVSVALTTPGGATLSGTKTVSAVAGVATFSGLSVDLANGYTLTATDGSLTTGASSSFTISPAAASKLVFAQQPSDANAGASLGSIQIAVEDAYGNTVTSDSSNVNVALTTAGGATLSGSTSVAASAGIATFTGLSVDIANSYSLVASDGPLTTATSSSFTISPAAPAKLAFTQQPASAASTLSIGTVEVAVQDSFGNTVTGDSSSVTVALTSAGGATLSGTKVVAAAGGVATFNGLSVDRAATYTLTAADGGLTSAQSSSFTISVGAAAKLAFTTQPSSTVNGGATLGTQPVVTVQDAGGNTVTTSSAAVTLALTTPAGATLTCTTNPLNATSGIASFAGCGIDKTGSYTLTATSGALSAAVSSTITVNVGPAASFTVTSSSGTPTAGTPVNITVTVLDAGGNVVTGYGGTVRLTSTDTSAVLPADYTFTGGDAGTHTFAVSLETAGPETVTATDTGNASLKGTTPTLTVSPGAASKLVFTSDTGSVVSGATKALAVQVQDGYGNVETSDNATPVTFAKTAGVGVVTGLANATASSGAAGLTVTGTTAGSVTITASSGSLTAATSTFSVTPGTATKVVFTSGTTSVASGATKTLTAAVEDANGNVETSDNSTSVTFARNSGAGTVAGLSSATVSSGIASLTVTGVVAGSITVGASSGMLATDASTFTVTPGTSTKVVFTSDTASVASGATKTLTAEVRDANDNLETSDNATVVTFAKTAGTGTLGGLAAATVSGGVATLAVTGGVAGPVTVTATSSGLAGDASAFSVTAGTTTKIAFTSTTTSVTSGATKTLTAQLQDAQGNPVASDNTTVVTFTKTSGTGVVTGLGTATASGGIATLTVTGTTAGSITVTASSGSLSADTSTFSVTPGAAAKVVFTSGAGGVASGSTKTLTAEIRDANDNLVTSDNSTVVTFSQTAGGGSLTGLGAVTASGGVVTLNVTGATVGSVTVTGASGPLTSGTSTFSVTAGPPTKVVFTSGAASVASGSTKTLTAAIEDVNGNVETTDSTSVVSFAQTAGSGAVTGLGAATVSGGIATLTVTGTTAGALAVTATSGGLTTDTSSFSVVAGPADAATSTISVSSASITADGTSTTTVTIHAEDANGNAIGTGGAAFALSTSRGSFPTACVLSCAPLDHGDGTYTLVLTSSTGAGTASITGTLDGLPMTASSTVAFVPGPAAKVVVTSSTTSVASGSTKTLTAEVRDANGNLETADNATVVTFATTGGAGTVGGLGTAVVSGGVASVTATGQLAGSVTVTASSGVLTADTTTFSVTPGPAATVVVTSGTGDLASATTRTLTAEIRDAAGNLVTGDNSTVVTFGQSGGSGSVTGLGTATASGGVASLTVTGQTAGAITIGATAGPLSAGSTSFTVVPGPAAAVVVTSDGSSVASGTTKTITAEVRDAAGNLRTADSSTVVTFSKSSGTGTVGGLGTATASSGVASLTVTGQTAGAIVLAATGSGLSGDSSSFSVTPGAAAKLVVTSSATSVSSGATKTLTVEVRDANDNVVTNDSSTVVTFTKTSGAGVVTGLGTATAANGVASLTVTGQTAGSLTVGATSGSLTADSTTFSVTPGAAAKIVFTSGTSNLASATTRTLTAEIRDANDNVVTTDSSTVVTFAQASGAGSVTGYGTATATNGVASLTVIGHTAGAVAITATGGPLTAGSTSFTVVPGAAAKVVVTSDGSSVASGATKTLTAEIRDTNDNLVSSDNSTVVTFAKSSGAGTVTGLGDATAANGIASLTVTGDLAGAIVVGATSGTLTADSTGFSVTPGPAAKLVVTSGTGNLTSGTTRTLTVEVRDANDNLVTTDNSTSVAFAKSSGTGTVTGLGSATASGGVASLTVTGQTAGAITVGVTSGSLTADSTAFSVVPGAASATTSTITVGSSTLTADGSSTTTVTVHATDASGNALTAGGDTVSLTASNGSLTTVTDDHNGLYTATLTAPTATGTAAITGTMNGLPLTSSADVDFVPGPAAAVVITSDTTNVASGATKTLTAQVQDAHGNLETGDSSTVVTFAKTSGAGTVTGLGDATAANGIASLTVTGDLAGAIVVGATSGTLTADSTGFSVTPGTAAKLVVTSGTGNLTSGATRTITVELRDASGNVVTGDSSTVVTLAQTAGSGSVTGLGTATAANGVASLTVTGRLAGAVTLGATSGSLTAGSTSFTVVPGAASTATSTMTASPTSITADGVSTSTITLRAKDAAGNLITTGGATVAMSQTQGQLSGVTDHGNGSYTATLTSAATVGSSTVSATLNGSAVTATASVAFVTGAASASTSTITVSSGSITADGTSTSIVTVHVKDSLGNDITTGGDTVALSTTAGTLTTPVDHNNGTYTATLTSATTVATATITGELNSASMTNQATVDFVPGPAAKVVFTSGTGNVTSGTTKTVTAEIRDANDNVETGDNSSSVGFAQTAGTGMVSGLTSATVSGGVASITVTGQTAGPVTITASSGGLTSDTSAFSVVAGAASAATSTITVGSSTLIADGTSSTTVTVHAKDANGNTVATGGDLVTLSSSNGSLSTVTDNHDGTYTATLTAPTATGTAAIGGMLNGLPLTASATVSFVPGPAAAVVITSAASSVASGATKQLTAEIHDAHGNLETGDSSTVVTFSHASGVGTVTGLGTATASNGVASLTVTGDVAGAIVVGATSGSLTADSSSFTVTPGAATKLVITSGTGTLAWNAGRTLTAEIRDANDNVVTTDNSTVVTFAKSGGSGTVTGLGAATASAGVASLPVTGGGAGAITIGATGGTLTAGSTSFTVVAGAPSAAGSTAVATPGTVTADDSSTSTVTVTLVDGGGNPVSGKTVTLTQPSGAYSTISAASGPTDASGAVTFTVHDGHAETDSYTATDTTDGVTLTHQAQVVFEDLNPPTATIASPATAVEVAGTITLAASGVADAETGIHDVAFDYCDSTAAACDPVVAGASVAGTNGGSGNWTATLDTTTLTSGHTYTWAAVATDNAANQTTTATRTFFVDNTIPLTGIVAPTLLTGATAQYWDGPTTTLWLRGGASGSFALNETASDGESGIARVSFPGILGTAAHDVTSPSSGTTYTSSAYAFNNQPSDLSPVTVTAANGVTVGTGAHAASSSLSIRVDSTAPTATLDASLDGKIVAGSLLLSAGSTDGGSGVASVAFSFCDRTADAVCVPNLAIGTTTAGVAGIYSKTWDTTSLVDGHAYAIAATSTDNVGNTTTSSIATVTVDNSAPTVAITAPTTSGDAYWEGSTLFVKATGTGSYTLNAHATDAQSGISGVTFGTDAGTTGGSGDYASPAYSFDGTTTPVGSSTATVTASNGVQLPAALTATDHLTITADATAPTTATQFPANNGGYDSNTWPTGSQACSGSQPEGLCGTVSDTGSGVAAVKLTLQDLGGGKYFDGTGFSSGVTTLNGTIAGANWSYPLDHAKLNSGTFELKVYAVDDVGNVELTHAIDFQYGNDLTPPDTQLTLKNATHAYLAAAGSHVSPNAGNDYVLYYSTAGNGGFTLHAVSTDVSGIDHIDFPAIFGTSGSTSTNGSAASPWSLDSPAYSFGASDTTAPGQKDVVSVDTAIPQANTGDDTLTFLVDNAAPTGGSVTVGPIAASGYATQTNLTVSHVDFSDGAGSGLQSSVLTVATATLTDGACDTFGSDAPVADGAFTATSGACYRFTLTGTDNVGNVATATQTVKVDTTPPSLPTAVFGNLSAGNTYDDGAGTLWYRPSANGAFSVTATSTDAESGIGSYSYSSLLGGTQTGGRLDVTFGAGGIGTGSYTVHATNRAGLDSTDMHFAVNADSTAPTGGALTVNGTNAAATPTSSYFTSGSTVTVDARTDYTDAQSGLKTSTLTVETAPLAHDSCGTWGAAQTITGTSQSVSNGNCYRFTLTGTDNVGNVASVSTIVMVDTTPPVAPTVSFGGLSSGNTYDDGHGKLWYRPSAGGTFSVTANGAADPETDIKSGNAGYTFSTLGGFLSSAQTGNRLDVTFDAASTGGASYSVVATNNAGVDSTPAQFTVAADGNAPTNGLLSISPYSSSLTVSISEQDFTDAESGIASNVLTRSNPQSASGGTCPANGYSGATNVPLSGGAASDTVPTDGSCYEYTLTGTDNVGNTATFRTIVLVDTTPATGGSVQSPDGLTSLDRVSVAWDAGNDAESGISQINVLRSDAPLSGTTCGSFGTFSTIASNPGTSPIVDSSVSAGNCYQYEIEVKNGAGLWATFTTTAVTKLTNASPIEVASTAGHTYLAGTTLWLGPGASTFDLDLTSVGRNGVTSADWSASAGSLSGAGVTATTGSFSSNAYTWDGTAPLNASISVTRQPTASVDSLTVQSDTTGPAGSIVYADGPNTTHSVPVSTAGISDGESGIGGIQILRSETTLTGSTCDTASWSAFAPVTLTAGHDTTVADEHCYRYEAQITDNVGNTTTATSTNVVQIPDITPPTFTSATTDVAGTQLTITMSEPLDPSSVPGTSRWVVLYNGVAQPAPTGVHLTGNQVVLDLATPPSNSQTVTVRYLSDGSLEDLASPTKNATTNFGPSPVTNATPDTVAPSVTSADVDGTTLTVHFDETLAGNPPAPSAFTVTVHGVTRTVTGVTMNGKDAVLTLSPAVAANDTVTVAYAVPALDALHDAPGNAVAPFTRSVTNNTAQQAAATLPAPPIVPVGTAPQFIGATPADGSTVTSVSSFTLAADRAVSWTSMTLTRPDGTVTPLADADGQTATYSAGTTAEGLYVVRGTITAGGLSTSVLTHFTIWTPQGTPQAPAVQKNAGASSDTVVSSDGGVAATWTPQTFGGDAVVIQVIPQPVSATTLKENATVVDVTAFMRDSKTPIKQLGDVLDVQFRNAPPNATPEMSQDAQAWSSIDPLPTLQLPAGQPQGWFRDSDGTVHVLTRHLTYFALLLPAADAKLALNIVTARRLWLAGRPFMAVRILVSTPARVTGNFVAPDGTVIPGQVLKTPTRRAGATVLRVPVKLTRPGLYRLQVHAEGAGQAVDKTARIRFVATQPTSPVWQSSRRLRVAVIEGARIGALGHALGPKYIVHTVTDANLYSAVDPVDPNAATAVVVDLATVPMASLASLHALLPELRIIGLTNRRDLAAQGRSIGVHVLYVRAPSSKPVTHVIEGLIPRR